MENKSTEKFLKGIIFFIVILLFLNIAVAGSIYFYTKHTSNTQKTTISTAEQTKDLVAKVGKLMVLPQDETPTIATVTDATKLKSQSFFQDAQNGDKVLIYLKAKKAILYDPTRNLIVDIAPLNSGQAPTPIPTAVPTRVKILVTPIPTSAIKSLIATPTPKI